MKGRGIRGLKNWPEKIKNGLLVPPLVAEFKGNQLVLAGGAHRCGALQLLGESTYWTAIWFNSKDDYDRFLETDARQFLGRYLKKSPVALSRLELIGTDEGQWYASRILKK